MPASEVMSRAPISWEHGSVEPSAPVRGGWRQRLQAVEQSRAAIARGADPSDVSAPPLTRQKVLGALAGAQGWQPVPHNTPHATEVSFLNIV